MAFNPQDRFFKKAKEQNFAARSVFKLEEIDQKLKLFKVNQKVLDLGASPGSWSQYAAKKIGPQGRILGVDLKAVTVKLPQAVFVEADLRSLDLREIFSQHGFSDVFDLVLSDMAPNTTGIRLTDQARSFELCELALQVAEQFLKPRGHFVCKLFHSEDFQTMKKLMLQRFERFEAIKPESTRRMSKEIFLIGMTKK
ncbi:MAG: RlmE family RNA methyltransferase [Bdellovibrionales bacterium]|jgi:23S rRNA (uridine2552-2'-O)-methyltransferase|nr:RlmE family RNA methyltransferase [Bdellovibrionales bacterium]MBL7670669.1 RlmE family RNA methyltransferase [Pseudobdellovibrionaceae bacterium]